MKAVFWLVVLVVLAQIVHSCVSDTGSSPSTQQTKRTESDAERRQRQWYEDNARSIRDLNNAARECSERPWRCQ